MNRRDFVVTGLSAACSVGCSRTLRAQPGAVKGCRSATAGADLQGRIFSRPPVPARWMAKYGACDIASCPDRFNLMGLGADARRLKVVPAIYFFDDGNSPNALAFPPGVVDVNSLSRTEGLVLLGINLLEAQWDLEDAKGLFKFGEVGGRPGQRRTSEL